jgi:hypothetical protein
MFVRNITTSASSFSKLRLKAEFFFFFYSSNFNNIFWWAKKALNKDFFLKPALPKRCVIKRFCYEGYKTNKNVLKSLFPNSDF